MRSTHFLAIAIFSFNLLTAQSTISKKLPWVDGFFPTNSSIYNYVVVQGDGTTLNEAQNKAVESLVFQLATEQGVSVSSNTVIKTQSLVRNQQEKFTTDYKDQIVINQDDFKTVFSKIDEYYELIKDHSGKAMYRTWQLYVTGLSASQKVPKILYSSKYNMSDAGFRSLIVPGWGQFYKKQNLKGFLFISAGIASVGNAIYASNKHSYHINRSMETSNLDLKKEYVKKANDFTTIKNISIAVAAVTWIWSAIDATSTDGAIRYTQYTPYRIDLNSQIDNSIAISFKYEF